MCHWQLKGQAQAALWWKDGGLKGQNATDLVITQTLCWGDWILLNSFHSLLRSDTLLSFSVRMENTFHMTWSHRPTPLGMGKRAFYGFSQINFQSNWASFPFYFFLHWTFSCAFQTFCLFWLISKQEIYLPYLGIQSGLQPPLTSPRSPSVLLSMLYGERSVYTVGD